MAVKTYYLNRGDGSKSIGKHFKVEDFKCRGGENEVLIDDDLITLLDALYYYAPLALGQGNLDIRIYSGYRSIQYDKAKGYWTDSGYNPHTKGQAADVYDANGNYSAFDLAYIVQKLRPNTGGIGTISQTNVHIDTRPYRYWMREDLGEYGNHETLVSGGQYNDWKTPFKKTYQDYIAEQDGEQISTPVSGKYITIEPKPVIDGKDPGNQYKHTGIDISWPQEGIDVEKVLTQTKYPIEFVICGVTGGKTIFDIYKQGTLELCAKHGIPFGIYVYNYADSKGEMNEHLTIAAKVINEIKQKTVLNTNGEVVRLIDYCALPISLDTERDNGPVAKGNYKLANELNEYFYEVITRKKQFTPTGTYAADVRGAAAADVRGAAAAGKGIYFPYRYATNDLGEGSDPIAFEAAIYTYESLLKDQFCRSSVVGKSANMYQPKASSHGEINYSSGYCHSFCSSIDPKTVFKMPCPYFIWQYSWFLRLDGSFVDIDGDYAWYDLKENIITSSRKIVNSKNGINNNNPDSAVEKPKKTAKQIYEEVQRADVVGTDGRITEEDAKFILRKSAKLFPNDISVFKNINKYLTDSFMIPIVFNDTKENDIVNFNKTIDSIINQNYFKTFEKFNGSFYEASLISSDLLKELQDSYKQLMDQLDAYRYNMFYHLCDIDENGIVNSEDYNLALDIVCEETSFQSNLMIFPKGTKLMNCYIIYQNTKSVAEKNKSKNEKKEFDSDYFAWQENEFKPYFYQTKVPKLLKQAVQTQMNTNFFIGDLSSIWNIFMTSIKRYYQNLGMYIDTDIDYEILNQLLKAQLFDKESFLMIIAHALGIAVANKEIIYKFDLNENSIIDLEDAYISYLISAAYSQYILRDGQLSGVNYMSENPDKYDAQWSEIEKIMDKAWFVPTIEDTLNGESHNAYLAFRDIVRFIVPYALDAKTARDRYKNFFGEEFLPNGYGGTLELENAIDEKALKVYYQILSSKTKEDANFFINDFDNNYSDKLKDKLYKVVTDNQETKIHINKLQIKTITDEEFKEFIDNTVNNTYTIKMNTNKTTISFFDQSKQLICKVFKINNINYVVINPFYEGFGLITDTKIKDLIGDLEQYFIPAYDSTKSISNKITAGATLEWFKSDYERVFYQLKQKYEEDSITKYVYASFSFSSWPFERYLFTTAYATLMWIMERTNSGISIVAQGSTSARPSKNNNLVTVSFSGDKEIDVMNALYGFPNANGDQFLKENLSTLFRSVSYNDPNPTHHYSFYNGSQTNPTYLGEYYPLNDTNELFFYRQETADGKYDYINLNSNQDLDEIRLPNTNIVINKDNTLNDILRDNYMNFAKIEDWHFWSAPVDESVLLGDKSGYYEQIARKFEEWKYGVDRFYSLNGFGGNDGFNGDHNQALFFLKMMALMYPGILLYREPDFNYQTGWRKNITERPESLVFWIDFFDDKGEISKYSVKAIGQRQKVITQDNINAIKYLDTERCIFIKPSLTEDELVRQQKFCQTHQGYSYFQMGQGFMNSLATSTQGFDAYSAIENMLYNYAQCAESVSVTCIPQYFLEPNTRISIYNPDTKINNIYNLTRISIPFGPAGSMSLSLTKALDDTVVREEIMKI